MFFTILGETVFIEDDKRMWIAEEEKVQRMSVIDLLTSSRAPRAMVATEEGLQSKRRASVCTAKLGVGSNVEAVAGADHNRRRVSVAGFGNGLR